MKKEPHKNILTKIRDCSRFLKTQFDEIANKQRETLIVGLLAVLLYFPAIWWGMPHATNPHGVHGWDVDSVTGLQTLSELHNLLIDPKPDWWVAYPLFHYFLLSFCYAPYFGFLYLTGEISQMTGEYPFGLRDPLTTFRHLTAIGRALTILMAAGIVVNVYLTARVVWDKPTARLAALFAALPTPMVYYARTGNLDVPVLFWTSLAVLLLARSLTYGLTMHRAVWLGIFAALAVATKDQAYAPLSVALLILIGIHLWSDAPKTVSRWKFPIVLFFSGLITFLFAGGIVFFGERFFRHIQFVLNFRETFWNVANLGLLHPPTPAGYAALGWDITLALVNAIGPVLLVTSIIGLIVAWRSSPFVKILAAMLVGYILLVVFPVLHMQYRYILFPAFVCAFFAARAVALGLQHGGLAAKAAILAAVLGFGWTGARAVDLTYQMIFDARYQAGEWLHQNGKAGDKLAYFSLTGIPPMPAGITPVGLVLSEKPIEEIEKAKFRFILIKPDFSSCNDADRSRFLTDSVYEEIKSSRLGYKKAASFKTRSLFGKLFRGFPLTSPHYVNPPVRIYELQPTENAAELMDK